MPDNRAKLSVIIDIPAGKAVQDIGRIATAANKATRESARESSAAVQQEARAQLALERVLTQQTRTREIETRIAQIEGREGIAAADAEGRSRLTLQRIITEEAKARQFDTRTAILQGREAERSAENAVKAAQRQEQAVKKAAQEQERAVKRSSDTRWQAASRMGTAAVSVGTGLSYGVSLPIVAALNSAIGVARDFDKEMRNVNSIAQLSEGQFDQLRKSVIGVAKDPSIRQGPEDLAKALYDIYSSGFQGQKALDILRQAAIGAGAGLTDTATSGRALMAVLNSNIRGVNGAQSAMDVLFKIVDQGVITFEQLANSIGQVLPTASQAGISIQEIGAAIAVLTKNGQSGSEATNDLLNLITKLIRPSRESVALFDKLGIGYGINALRAKGLTGVLQDVMDKTGGNQRALAALFPDMQAMRAAMSLLQKGGKDYASSLDAMSHAQDGAGATQRAAAEQSKSLDAEMKELTKEFKIIAAEAGPALIRALRDALAAGKPLIDAVRDLAERFSKLSPEAQRGWLAVAGVAAMVGPTLVAVGKIVGAINTIRDAWVAAKAAKEAAMLAEGAGAAGKLGALARVGVPAAAAAAVGYVAYQDQAAHQRASEAQIRYREQTTLREQLNRSLTFTQQYANALENPGESPMPKVGTPAAQESLQQIEKMPGRGSIEKARAYLDLLGKQIKAVESTLKNFPHQGIASAAGARGLLPHVAAARSELSSRFGIRDIGGYRREAVDPHGHPAGRALDVMVGKNAEEGNRVAQYAMDNAKRLGVQYVIWQQRINKLNKEGEWTGWKKMADRGSPTANHIDHVHINFNPVEAGASRVAGLGEATGGNPNLDAILDAAAQKRDKEAESARRKAAEAAKKAQEDLERSLTVAAERQAAATQNQFQNLLKRYEQVGGTNAPALLGRLSERLQSQEQTTAQKRFEQTRGESPKTAEQERLTALQRAQESAEKRRRDIAEAGGRFDRELAERRKRLAEEQAEILNKRDERLKQSLSEQRDSLQSQIDLTSELSDQVKLREQAFAIQRQEAALQRAMDIRQAKSPQEKQAAEDRYTAAVEGIDLSQQKADRDARQSGLQKEISVLESRLSLISETTERTSVQTQIDMKRQQMAETEDERQIARNDVLLRQRNEDQQGIQRQIDLLEAQAAATEDVAKQNDLLQQADDLRYRAAETNAEKEIVLLRNVLAQRQRMGEQSEKERQDLLKGAMGGAQKELTTSALTGKLEPAKRSIDAFEVAYTNAKPEERIELVRQYLDELTAAEEASAKLGERIPKDIFKGLRQDVLRLTQDARIGDPGAELTVRTNIADQKKREVPQVFKDIEEGADRAGESLLHRLLGGENRRAAFKGFWNELQGVGLESLSRWTITDVLKPQFDKLGKYLSGALKGGVAEIAAQAYGLATLLGGMGKKKQKKGFLGGLLGVAVGSLIPGGSLVTDFLTGSAVGGLFASGGRPPLGKVSLAGERGPELFIPDRPGMIVNSQSTRDVLRMLSPQINLPAIPAPVLSMPSLPSSSSMGGTNIKSIAREVAKELIAAGGFSRTAIINHNGDNIGQQEVLRHDESLSYKLDRLLSTT